MISLKELRTRLALTPDKDDQLKILLPNVISLWEARTNRLWNKRTDHEEEFQLDEDYQRKAPIFLDLTPILSITKIEVWDDGDDASPTELDTDDYKLLVKRGKLTRIPQTTYWPRNVRVTYTGGYDSTTSPGDVRETLAIQAQYILHRHAGEKSVASGIQGPSGGVTFLVSADVHPHFKQQAILYRRHR